MNRLTHNRLAGLVLSWSLVATGFAAEPAKQTASQADPKISADQMRFFETRIRPVLVEH